jgi:hypothetical protein
MATNHWPTSRCVAPPRMKTSIARCSLLCLAFVAACGRPSDGRILVPTSGRVMLDAKALEGALVTFVPQSAGGIAASATTDAGGRYDLLTPGASRPGVVPGSYAVTIMKMETRQLTAEDQAMATVKMRSSGLSMPPPTTESTQVLPARYRSPEESGLTASVSEKERKSFDFELSGK